MATVTVGSGPEGVAITPDGAFAYVANSGSNTVSVIATASNTVVATVTVGSGPEGVAITPDGAFAYVANSGSNTVSVIATASNTVVATVTVGSAPFGVAITPLQNPVPVELSSFTAESDGSRIKLKWTTQSESNNLGFDVERSSDQESFSKIGFVPGNFTTSTPKFYTFVDSDLEVGTYFYRLKQIDTDGAFEYSPVVTAAISAPTAFVLHQNFPNPFNLETKIPYELAEKTEVSIFIFNLLGRKIRTLVDEVNGPGSFEIAWDGKDERGRIAPSGIYFMQMRVGEVIQLKKVALSK